MRNPFSAFLLPRMWTAGLLLVLAVTPARADVTKAPAALEKAAPETVEDLKAIQSHVKEVLKKVVPATVGLQVGGASGSGVIIDKEGHVLTAGHVSGAPDKPVTIIFPDGRKVKGKTLGGNRDIDSGLVKITDKGDWPFVEMGKSSDLKRGQWVLAVGQPGGFRPNRTPPVRLGRVLDSSKDAVRTDCTLVGGDSGGPLFDMRGRVVGIHSRINGPVTANIHVPVNTFQDTWNRLAKGEVFGGPAYLGVERDEDFKEGVKVKVVRPDSPAAKAGLKVGDVISKFDGKDVTSDEIRPLIMKRRAGDKVTVEVKRGEETLKLDILLGTRN